MTNTILQDLKAEALPGGRVMVTWTNETSDFQFVATFAEDRLLKIHDIAIRRFPTIVERRRRVAGDRWRGNPQSLYYDAQSPEWAPVVANIAKRIADEKLVTTAQDARAKWRAEEDAKIANDKAAAIRRLFDKHFIPFDKGLSDDVATLAAFYDDVQNSAV